MKNRWINLIVVVILFSLALQACGMTAPAAPTAVPPQPTDTPPAVMAATATSLPAQPTAPAPTSTPTSIPTPTQIVHLTKPGEPSYIGSQTTIDCILGRTYVSTAPVVIPPVCDNWSIGFIERPVAADEKTYLPYLDIGKVQLGANANWVFASISVYDLTVATVGTGDVYYFFKLDLNFDGRDDNDIVFSVKNLSQDSLTWTVNGVQAWSDVNGTITPIFDQGVGTDPDLIWARRSPNAIEFAFKPALVNANGPSRFDWWAWSYQGTLTPPDLAFSPIPTDTYQIDNTCAWGFNVSSTNLVNTCIR